MRRFCDDLKLRIANSGESIAAIARGTGVERTLIHKALAGERTLPYPAVRALARHLKLTLEERQEFFRLYNIALMGESHYQNRQAVAGLLNRLADTRFQMAPPAIVPKLCVDEQLIQGEYAVRSAIRSVLAYESAQAREAEFGLCCPPGLDLALELTELWMGGRNFQVSQLFCFTSGSDDFAGQNISILGSVILQCLVSRGGYRPYYFREPMRSSMVTPLGCYIITPGCLIQFAEDLSAAQIRRDPALVDYFCQQFEKLLLLCEPLTCCSSDIRDTLDELIHEKSTDEVRILMNQPCLGRYITGDLIRKYLNSSSLPYEQMFGLVEKRFAQLRGNGGLYCTVFTEKGLRSFATAGVMEDMPPEYVPPLQAEDVRMFLMRLRDDIASGAVEGLIARPTYLKIPDYLEFYVDENTGVHIYTNNDFICGAYCCNIHILEKSVTRVFLDFFQALRGGSMVYSQEDTLRLLDQQLRGL